MSEATLQEVRRLRRQARLITVVLAAIVLAAARQAHVTRFTELDVERINVIEPDGTLRLTLSNRALLPDPIIGGRAYPLRSGDPAAGLLFFNEEGNEAGGLIYSGAQRGDGARASAGLSLDQFDQDEALTISYAEANGRRSAGLTISDRPDWSIQPFADTLLAVVSLRDSVAKQQRIQTLTQTALQAGELGARRVFVGRDTNGSAVFVLNDPQGRPRLELVVTAAGAARVHFLDADGRVMHRYAPAGQ